MQKINAVGGAMLLVLVAFAACGGEDEGGNTAPGWSIPDDAVLGTLTDSEKDALCKDSEKYLMTSGLGANSKEALCRIQGVVAAAPAALLGTADDAALQAACKEAYDPCVAAAPWMCTAPTSTCKATLGEFRACLDEAGAASAMGLDVLPPCNELSRAKVLLLAATYMDLLPKTPACDTFQMKCPDVEIPIPKP